MSKDFVPKKVEIITVRSVLFVQPGWLQGAPDRVEVDACVKCGSVVLDVIKHDGWHREQDQQVRKLASEMRGVQGI